MLRVSLRKWQHWMILSGDDFYLDRRHPGNPWAVRYSILPLGYCLEKYPAKLSRKSIKSPTIKLNVKSWDLTSCNG